MSKMKFLMLTAAVLFALSASAGAYDVTVPNAGFEDRETFEPFPESTDKYLKWAQESWRHFEVDNNGGPVRIWNVGVPGTDETPQGVIDVAFGGSAAEGDYAALVRSRYNDDEFHDPPQVRDFEAIAQILDETFDPTLTYTLTAKVGRLPEGPAEGGSINYLWTPLGDPAGAPVSGWYGYALQLAVGGTNVGGSSYQGRVEGGTVIAQDWNTTAVAIDSFATVSLTYSPDPANAGLAGQPLQIRLCVLEDPADHSLTQWAIYDDVTLDAIPEPMTLALLGLGGLGLIRRRRRA